MHKIVDLNQKVLMMEADKETVIFNELQDICTSLGFIHVIAILSFQDNYIRFLENITGTSLVSDIAFKHFQENIKEYNLLEKLSLPELAMLMGLMCKSQVCIELIPLSMLQVNLDRVKKILTQLHETINMPMRQFLKDPKPDDINDHPFSKGVALREAFFYGGEAAYDFQYREFSQLKYKRDYDWIFLNKGFSIAQATEIIDVLQKIQLQKILTRISIFEKWSHENYNLLDVFTVAISDFDGKTSINQEVIRKILKAFSMPKSAENLEYTSPFKYNMANTYPIIPINDNEYIVFQSYMLFKALYENPPFWMRDMDSDYAKKVYPKNRGLFTEDFCYEYLIKIFSSKHVFRNVFVYVGKNNVTDADVLVVYYDKLIIVQCKSKRLTLPSFEGNDETIQKDIKKAVLDAYGQGKIFADIIEGDNFNLKIDKSIDLKINTKIKEIYILCVVCDGYPALSLNAKYFLKYNVSDIIKPPLVMDIFFLDILIEILDTPFMFLNFIKNRSRLHETIYFFDELDILSAHLDKNLNLYNPKKGEILVGLSADHQKIHNALYVRRGTAKGDDYPDGAIYRAINSTIGQIILNREMCCMYEAHDLCQTLLSFNDENISKYSKIIDLMVVNFKKKKINQKHSLKSPLDKIGLTIHCNSFIGNKSKVKLMDDCKERKYLNKYKKWYGISIDYKSKRLKTMVIV